MLSVRASRLCLLVLAIGCKRTPEIEEPSRPRGPEPTTAAMTAAPQPPAPSGDCVLSIPKNDAELPIFPTQDGLIEYGKSADGGDHFQMATVMQKQHAVLVASKTPCERLEAGPNGNKVRVTAGAQLGQVGWVAADWTKGQ
jgi:hypothetical protein